MSNKVMFATIMLHLVYFFQLCEAQAMCPLCISQFTLLYSYSISWPPSEGFLIPLLVNRYTVLDHRKRVHKQPALKAFIPCLTIIFWRRMYAEKVCTIIPLSQKGTVGGDCTNVKGMPQKHDPQLSAFLTVLKWNVFNFYWSPEIVSSNISHVD